jgi:hypothetical protein
MTFSRTLIVLKRLMFWNVRAMPRRTIRWGGVFRRVVPSSSTSPESGL